MGTWRGTGRRALAVGAGALLIGALGAGPAYAGTDNDDDEYTYVDDSCSDYHESWYFEHGYDYDEHWDDDRDHGDHDRWDKDRWDHGKDWHRGDDWKKHWDDKDFYVKDGKVYDKKTNKPIFDLGSGTPIGGQLPIHDPVTVLTAPQQNGTETEKTVTEAPKTEQKTESSEQAPAEKKPATSEKTEQEKAPAVVEPETVTPPSSASTPSSKKVPSSSTTSDGQSVTVEPNAVVTDLASSDPWDGRDKDRDGDRDWNKDRDWDRDKDDHGWWDGWWEKESWTVSVSCYEDKESSHRWYDDRPVGKVEATEVKTVPKGGVNTGN